ncbi:oligopeptide ABC transporter permease [Pseudoneobacillus rhizosphaerae]|jgi:peptide/nickel transport system permease protein|uniref:Oligopeptide transport system permease protein OppC n=1 Tax=Pseudoneobacillus rhizosphaerae TaxID=2880968 RepID=A0A9C7GC10_9BACI|nr:oligopeptide ABC transporter permease [Pseudoneobacillus rhizosphaerae]CAG9609553.1 Oligopeptide transport system permease protein OppC [Pseudoneobacillus rhizosphaerae]
MGQPEQKTTGIFEYKNSSILERKPESISKIMLRKYMKNKLAVFSAIILLLIISAAIFAPIIAPYDPSEQHLLEALSPPGEKYLLGTDDLGRDTLTRLLYGAQVSLIVGFTSVAGSIFIGTVVGAIAGYFGGLIDAILMRFVDVIISFPSLFLLITLVTIFEPSLMTLISVFALFGWTGTARLVRGEFLSLRSREFVLAAKTMGIRSWRIIFSHILPNAMGPIVVSATLGIGGVILAETALSYLGLGIQPPKPSWGNMLQSAQSLKIMIEAWWFTLFPGLMILITVLSFNFVGDGLRDAFDPKINE